MIKSILGFSKLRGLALGASVASTVMALGYSGIAQAGEHVLVLIDKSGSMNTTSVSGDIRWNVAKQLASDAVGAVAPDREYSLWTFSGSNFTPVVQFVDGLTAAQVAFEIENNLGSPGGSTPLAGSICDAVDELIDYLPSEFHLKRIELFSDGLENTTPSTHECWGPDSVDHSSPDEGSWEWKVYNKVRTGNPNSVAAPPIPLVVNADYLFEHESAIFTPMFSAWALPQRGSKPVFPQKSPLISSLQMEQVQIPSKIAVAPIIELAQSIDFYKNLATKSGGRYRQFTSKSKLPQLGDTTGDYCVDYDDYYAIIDHWGNSVAPGSLLDPNQDGTVDTYDYSTVLQNWGEGC